MCAAARTEYILKNGHSPKSDSVSRHHSTTKGAGETCQSRRARACICAMSGEETSAASTPAANLELLRDEGRLLETLNRVGRAGAAGLGLESGGQIGTEAGTQLFRAALRPVFL